MSPAAMIVAYENGRVSGHDSIDTLRAELAEPGPRRSVYVRLHDAEDHLETMPPGVRDTLIACALFVAGLFSGKTHDPSRLAERALYAVEWLNGTESSPEGSTARHRAIP